MLGPRTACFARRGQSTRPGTQGEERGWRAGFLPSRLHLAEQSLSRPSSGPSGRCPCDMGFCSGSVTSKELLKPSEFTVVCAPMKCLIVGEA